MKSGLPGMSSIPAAKYWSVRQANYPDAVRVNQTEEKN
jgi:hypothetical protein